MSNLRTYLLLSALLSQLISFAGFGQTARRPDQIVRNDNSIIEGLISEINETAIYYRKPAAPQGQQYQLKKADVSYVRYSNGEIERFDGKTGQAATASRASSTAPTTRDRVTSSRNVPAPARPEPAPNRATAPLASSSEPHTRFGITAGAGGGFWMAQGTSSDIGLAFRGGLTAEIPLGGRVALAPSVEYVQLTQGKSPNTFALNYGVVTLAAASLYNDAKPVNLFYSVGVYGAYGLNITAKGESASFKDAGINSFHAGSDLKLGARFSQGLTVYVQGDYGFTSMATVAGAPAVSQLTFGAGLRYLFGK